jgi:hypothetical protein
VPHFGLRHVIGLSGLLRRRSRVMRSLQSHGRDGLHSWLLHHARRTSTANEWAQVPLVVMRRHAAQTVRRLRHLACRTWFRVWVSNGRFGFLYGTNSDGEMPNSSPCYSNLQRPRTETTFLIADLEACPAPLHVMASDQNCGKRPWCGNPNRDGCQLLSHRARMNVAPSRASPSTRWGFTLRR